MEAFFQLWNARMAAQAPQGTPPDSRGALGATPLPSGSATPQPGGVPGGVLGGTPAPQGLTPQASQELVSRASSMAVDPQGLPVAEASDKSFAETQAPFLRCASWQPSGHRLRGPQSGSWLSKSDSNCQQVADCRIPGFTAMQGSRPLH